MSPWWIGTIGGAALALLGLAFAALRVATNDAMHEIELPKIGLTIRTRSTAALALMLGTGLFGFSVYELGRGDPAPKPPSEVSKEFARKADEICDDTVKRANEIKLPDVAAAAARGDVSAEHFGREIDRFEAVLRERRKRFSDLDKPEGQAGEIAREFVIADETAINQLLGVLR